MIRSFFNWQNVIALLWKSIYQKTAIPLDYNQKQCIKSPQIRQINSSTSPFRFHEDPGLHLFHTRISHALPPGSEETFQVVFTKKVACLHEKTSLFMLFCISFWTYLLFYKSLVYNTLLLFDHDGYDRWMIVENRNYHRITNCYTVI